MRRKISLFTTVFCFLIPAVSWSASEKPGPYVSGFIGVTIPQDKNVNSTSFDGATFRTFSDRVEFDPGLNIGGTGGYDFGFVRLEGEMSYKYSEIKSITASDGFRFGRPDGNLGVFAIMGNGFFDLHNASNVTPYLGGGIGFANMHLSETFGIDTSGEVPLYPEDDDTVFAYQVGAGVGIALNRRLTLDIGYRYFGTSRAKFRNILVNGDDGTADFKFESHNAAIGLRVKF